MFVVVVVAVVVALMLAVIAVVGHQISTSGIRELWVVYANTAI